MPRFGVLGVRVRVIVTNGTPGSIRRTQLSPRLMQCDEKLCLAMKCVDAATKFSHSVSDLNAKTGVLAQEQYEQQKGLVDECRAAMDQARRALDRHVSIHGCGEPN